MNSVGFPAVRGTASSTSPPMRCSTPSAFCVAKYRSATSPTKKGAAIAAIGFTLNGQELSVAMPWLLMYTAMVVYHAPQMKNSRNIIAPRRVPRDRMTGGLECESSDLLAGRGIVLDEVWAIARRLGIHASLEVQHLHLPEVDFSRLGLEGDRPAGDRLALDEHARVGIVRRPAPHLGLPVHEHRVPVGDVLHDRIAEGEELHAHPLTAVVGLGRRVDAVARDEGIAEVDIGARRTEVRRRARLAVTEPAEELHLERDGEVLVQPHALRRLAVRHDAVVALRPGEARTGAGHLIADEAILRRDEIVLERALVEDVPELAVERGPLVVADLEQPVLDAERVVVVIAERMLGELDVPVGQVPTVEHLDPVRLGRAGDAGTRRRGDLR